MIIITCSECSNTFPAYKNKKTCSIECSIKRHNKLQAELNKKRGVRKTNRIPIDWDRATTMIKDGIHPVEIAKILGCSSPSIFARRKRMKSCTKTVDDAWAGVKAPLELVDRSTRAGFKRYYSQRPEHFYDVFGEEYSEEAANRCFI
jgi:hypothetical protein